ncbi:MAG: LysR family transcriptional regulator [Pseudomonadota bacterium]
MQSDWNDLQIFLAVERGKTAREAAARLKVSHSTVLRRLDAFEQRVGAKLFDRTPDGFLLTEAGSRIIARAQQVEAEMLELERLVDGHDVRLKGPIRLTVPPPIAQFLLLPMLMEFRRQYPLIDIELVTTYAYSDLSRRDADLAIRFSEKPEEHLVGRRLPPFRDAVYASPDYVEDHVGPNATEPPEWISWPDRAAFRNRTGTTPFADSPVAWILPTLPLQSAAARNSMGMAFLPCIVGDSDPLLVRVPNSGLHDGRPAWLLTHPDLRHMERVRVFSKFLAEAIVAESALVSGGA